MRKLKDKLNKPVMVRLSEKDRELLELKSSTDDTSMADIARDFIKLGLSTVYPDQYLPKIDADVLKK